MNSRVVKLYDWKLAKVPQEMKPVSVSDGQIEEQLLALSKKYGIENEADEAHTGDTVQCSCSAGTLRGRSVLVYPGLGLPGAEEAEGRVLSCRVGDGFMARIHGEEQALTVEKILRRNAAAIDDALVCREDIAGVTTVEDYRRWYREKTEAENRKQAGREIGYFLQDTVAERSEYAIEEEELYAWTQARAREEFEECIAMGEDPRIPEEGLTFLTDEEAVEKIRREFEKHFRLFLVAEYLHGQDKIAFDEDDIEFALLEDTEAGLAGDSDEERDAYRRQLEENELMIRTIEFFCDKAEALL